MGSPPSYWTCRNEGMYSRGMTALSRTFTSNDVILSSWLNAARHPRSRRSGARRWMRSSPSSPPPPRRLPRADQPALVDAGAARPHRAHRSRGGQRDHDHDPARPQVGGPPARPVPAGRRRRRRGPPLAGLLADLRAGPARRPHLHHAEAGARGQGLALLRREGPPGDDRAARRGRGLIRDARPRARRRSSSSAPAAASRRS